jgi:hypothetical protein
MQNFRRLLILASLAVAAYFTAPQLGVASPSSGSNCAACHSNVDDTKSTVQAPGTHLGLASYDVAAGSTVALQLLVNDTGGDPFGVALSGGVVNATNRTGTVTLLPTGSVTGLNNSSNLLKFGLDSAWATRVRNGVQWYTIGALDSSEAGLKTYNMAVDATTPSDYYLLTFQTGGGFGDWADPQAFYVHVTQAVPEPSTLALMGCGAVGLVFWRRRRRAR